MKQITKLLTDVFPELISSTQFLSNILLVVSPQFAKIFVKNLEQFTIVQIIKKFLLYIKPVLLVFEKQIRIIE